MVKNDNIPLVSIICITYNHENFIRQAIDGFLIQNTSFQIEIIIHDDASTDNTQAIVKEYELKYPGLFNNIYQTENQYSKNDLHLWGDITFPLAKGKYIAMCEGDDYWTDPNNLQRQIDFLEENESFVMSFHGANLKAQNGEILKNNYTATEFRNNNVKLEDIMNVHFIATSSIVFKRNILANDDLRFIESGDIWLLLLLRIRGEFYYLNEICSVYRIHTGGISQSHIGNKKMLSMIHLLGLFNNFTRFEFHNLIQHAQLKSIKNFYEISPKYLLNILRKQSYKNLIKLLIKVLLVKFKNK